MTIQQINHVDLAESRLANEFKNASNLIAYLRAMLKEADNIEQVLLDIINTRTVDNAEGVVLDIIGSIVGQSRYVDIGFQQPEVDLYFGFKGYPYSNSFGTLDDPLLGKRMISLKEFPSTTWILPDDTYRKFIRARITRNHTGSTPEDIISHVKFVFEAELIHLVEGAMKYYVSIGKILTQEEKSILRSNIMVKPVGVSVKYTTEFSSNFFAFSGVRGAKGFGSLSDPLVGGTLGNLIF